MEYRVEQLAARAEVSVDTVRYYQARGLLPPGRRAGRVALYGDDHLARIERIRALQAKGLTLAAIRRLLDGELDVADEALAAAVARPTPGPARPPDAEGEVFGIEELARRSGIPHTLLESLAREGLLLPARHDGEPAFTNADVEAAAAGLRLLEQGLPLPEVLALARRHHTAMREVAEAAVTLFDAHVRRPLRQAGPPGDEAARRLVEAFHTLLPATTKLVGHHFERVLLAVAQEHIEHVGDETEVPAVHAEAG